MKTYFHQPDRRGGHWTRFAILLGYLWFCDAAFAYSTECYKEVREICQDVAPGDGRLTNCVTQNQGKFSAKCRPEIHAVIEQRWRFDAYCGKHAALLCPGIKPGQGRLYSCLKFHEDQLGANCKAQLP